MGKVTALTIEQGHECPIRQVLSQVTGKWQMLIVLTLGDGPLRFGALKREVGDITQRVLTENLRKLERDGYIDRSVDPGPPVAVTYSLTELGTELCAHLETLSMWALSRHPQVNASRKAFGADAFI